MTSQDPPRVHHPANDNSTGRAVRGLGKPCPICGKPAEADTKPFCSKRCADVDLHRWLGGSYAIPVSDIDGHVPDDDDP